MLDEFGNLYIVPAISLCVYPVAETEKPVEVILSSNCGDKELDIYSYPGSHSNGSQQLYHSFKDGQMNVNAVPWLASEILKP